MNKMTIIFIVRSLALLFYGAKVYADNRNDSTKTETKDAHSDSIVQSTTFVAQAVVDSLNYEVDIMKSDLSSVRSTIKKICYIGGGLVIVLLLLVILALINLANKASKNDLDEKYNELNTKIHKLKDDLRGDKGKPVTSTSGSYNADQNFVEVNNYRIGSDRRGYILSVSFKGCNQWFSHYISKDHYKHIKNSRNVKEIIELYFKNEIEKIRSQKKQSIPIDSQNEIIEPKSQEPIQENPASQAEPIEERKPTRKILYLVNNDKELFIRSSEQRLDNTPFVIEYDPYDGSNQGILSIIGAIEVLKVMNSESRDFSIKVVKPNCTWNEATRYEQKDTGLVEKYESGWRIVKPVEITLIK